VLEAAGSPWHREYPDDQRLLERDAWPALESGWRRDSASQSNNRPAIGRKKATASESLKIAATQHADGGMRIAFAKLKINLQTIDYDIFKCRFFSWHLGCYG